MDWTARLTRLSAYLPARDRVIGGVTQALTSATAAIIAYLPAKPFGLREGFWASITAIAVVQGQLSVARTSARDQFAGAALGGLISGLAVMLAGQNLAVYAFAVVASVLACWLSRVPSAARLAGSTATIIVLVPHQGSTEWMMMSRIAEVGWGITVAITTVWIVNRIEKSVSTEQEAPK